MSTKHKRRRRNRALDRTHAPAGCYAALNTDGCIGCCYESEPAMSCGVDRPCCGDERPDGCDVIFQFLKTIRGMVV